MTNDEKIDLAWRDLYEATLQRKLNLCLKLTYYLRKLYKEQESIQV